MKKLSQLVTVAIAATLLVSCGKPQTDEERKAEVDRQVQERLAAEHQADEQQKLSQREADVAARESAVAAQQNQPADTATPAPQPADTSSDDTSADTAQDSGDSGAGGDNYDTFYTKLEPYGAWRETSDYGYVFQPDIARSPHWRPYTNGHWVYTDAGWTWKSDESFGWATDHYGRWARLSGVGWVWVPGNEWAPAWVSWRKSNEYVGWAPLPPEARFDRNTGIHAWADNYYDIGPDQYAFVPTAEFGNQQIASRVVASSQNATIIQQTTNVTNITYSNTTVINQGPNYDEMRQRTHQPIERLRLERQTHLDTQNPRAIISNQAIQMPAPVIANAASQRPRKVQGNLGPVKVEHGWNGAGDPQAVAKAREKMKSQGAPSQNMPPRTFVKPAAVAAPARTIPAATSATDLPTPVRNFQGRPKLRPGANPTPVPIVPPMAHRPENAVPATGPEVPHQATTPVPVAPRQRPVAPPPHVAHTPVATVAPRPIAPPRPASTPAAPPTAHTLLPSETPVPRPPSPVPVASPRERPPVRRPHGPVAKPSPTVTP